MSLFLVRAPQIWLPMTRLRKSQLRAGNDWPLLQFVSSEARLTKRRDARYTPPRRRQAKRQPRPMRAVLTSLILCSALACAPARAAEPSSEAIEHGKALVIAGDCTSCHTADPAKPFAG